MITQGTKLFLTESWEYYGNQIAWGKNEDRRPDMRL